MTEQEMGRLGRGNIVTVRMNDKEPARKAFIVALAAERCMVLGSNLLPGRIYVSVRPEQIISLVSSGTEEFLVDAIAETLDRAA